MERVKLVKISHLTNDKNGQPLVSKKSGKPYTRVLLDLADGRTAVSGFGNKTTQSWKEGDEVDIIITQNGQYWNFDLVKESNVLADRVSKLEQAVFGESRENKVPAVTTTAPELDDF